MTIARSLCAVLLVVATSASAQTAVGDIATPAITHREQRAAFDGAAANFTGKVHVDMLVASHDTAPMSAGSVTFAPGARTAWHTHPAGQTLIVTAGLGRIQFWGGPVRDIRDGDVVWIPAGVKHWHGAAPGSSTTHIAMAGEVDGKSVVWMEQVTPAQYDPAPTPTASASTTAAQKLLGDVAPGLAQLTDDVLFGDVWNRPGLSKRDRSLVTVSALVAMNRPEQLRSHLALARQNGLSQEELTEAITHLAFYAGWPSAVTAVGVARDVFAAH